LTAVHGSEAVSLYARQKDRITAVIVDMMMPVMDGPQTIRMLKEMNPALRIVAMSGLWQGDQMNERFAGQDVALLAKPFRPDQLLEVLHQALNGATVRQAQAKAEPNVAP
jgi:CheY-like chemotaxis protein